MDALKTPLVRDFASPMREQLLEHKAEAQLRTLTFTRHDALIFLLDV
jgi:hypothetical protein